MMAYQITKIDILNILQEKSAKYYFKLVSYKHSLNETWTLFLCTL